MVWLSFWVLWDTFISNISNITIIMISSIGNSLNTAIGKVDLVGTMNSLAVSSFSSLEVSSRVVISYSIFKGIRFWGFIIYLWFAVCWSRVIRSWSRMIRSWRSNWEGSSTSHKGTHNSKTEHFG
jgi:hypothetical protein